MEENGTFFNKCCMLFSLLTIVNNVFNMFYKAN